MGSIVTAEAVYGADLVDPELRLTSLESRYSLYELV